jgi:hypothetical protein
MGNLLNRRKMMKNITQYLGAIAIAASVTGCASVPPPTEELALSRAAVANAVSAGAREFAAPDLSAAQDKIAKADQMMTAKNYEAALWLAEQAHADADVAAARARSAQARKALFAAQEDSRVLREELNRKSK